MIGFIVKKAFFDAWDNFLKLIVFNFMTVPFIGLFFLGFDIIVRGNKLGILVIFSSIIGLLIHQGTVFYFVRDIGDCKSITFADYFKHLKKDFKIKLQFSISWSIFISITSFSIIYYYSKYLQEGVWSMLAPLALVFWFSTMTSVAILVFYPIKIRLEGNFRRVLKKCFILMFDNPGASIFIFIYSVFLLILSIPSLGLLPPGLSSIACVLDTTVHMYELKYDYLEKNPDADRKKIPWIELTYELNENIGPRTLKGMIFPWKD